MRSNKLAAIVKISSFVLLCISSVYTQDNLISIESKNLNENYQKELLHYKAANAYLKNKQYDKALSEFKKIRMTNPLHLKVDESIKECRINLGKWISPDTETDDIWVEIDPYNLANLPKDKRDSVFDVAKKLDREERFRNAQKIMSQLVALAPNNKEYKEFYTTLTNKIENIKQTLFEIGEEFYKRGLYAQALKEWYKTLFYSPDDNLLLSNIQNAEKKLKELRSYYVTQIAILEANNKENELLVLLNNIFHQFPTDEIFKNKYDSIQNRRESILNSRIDEGQNYYLEGDYDNAEEVFSKLFTEYPDNLTVAKWNNSINEAKEREIKNKKSKLMITTISDLISENKISEAEFHLNKLRSFDPSNTQITKLDQQINGKKRAIENDKAYNNIIKKAKIALNSGSYTKAKKLLNQAGTLKPGSKTVEQMQKILNNRESVDVPAIKDRLTKIKELIIAKKYSEAEKLMPRKTGIVELDKAIKYLNRTIRKAKLKKIPPHKIEETFLAGISSYRMGEYKKALMHWQNVLKMSPNHKQAETYVINVKKKIRMLEGK